MKKIQKVFVSMTLTVTLLFTTTNQVNSGIPILDDGMQASMVGLLASIESLNSIANSNTVKVLSHAADMAESMAKVVRVIQDMSDLFQKSKIVMEMAVMTVNIYHEYIEFVNEIYRNEDLLAIEEIEMFVKLLDYTVFDAAAEAMNKGEKTTLKGVAGGAFQQLEDIFLWIKTSGYEKQTYQDLENKVAITYQKLSRTSRDLRIMRKYAYAYMVSNRYRKGAFNNSEYIRYVYYSRHRQAAVKKLL
ncbi:hypothetical protein FACS1894199_03030 [Bacteroidia bacterium]|nr:hypothetical protein FACS1894199_03030 [Bacteroidia bacterium]